VVGASPAPLLAPPAFFFSPPLQDDLPGNNLPDDLPGPGNDLPAAVDPLAPSDDPSSGFPTFFVFPPFPVAEFPTASPSGDGSGRDDDGRNDDASSPSPVSLPSVQLSPQPVTASPVLGGGSPDGAPGDDTNMGFIAGAPSPFPDFLSAIQGINMKTESAPIGAPPPIFG
jgi:hypothetical protein